MSYSVKFTIPNVSQDDMFGIMLNKVGYNEIGDEITLEEIVYTDPTDPTVYEVDVYDTVQLHDTLVRLGIAHTMDKNGQMFCEI